MSALDVTRARLGRREPNSGSILYDDKHPPTRDVMINFLIDVNEKMQAADTAADCAAIWYEQNSGTGYIFYHIVLSIV